ncbi:MAG: FxLYD domain-containing protein [Muribaculaceae bacterium]|nr:FxLYD domain-containing protein [Muribaculaceae bacterium]
MKLYHLILVLALLLTIPLPSAAKKNTLKLKTEKQSSESAEDKKMVRGSFMVASQCTDCNNGYTLDQIKFFGYDKPAKSNKESFFLTNMTDRTLSGVSIYITYYAADGRMLHRRFAKLQESIPPGETRKLEIPSWDKNHSFRFAGSQDTRSKGAAYTVTFDPVAYYLRF